MSGKILRSAVVLAAISACASDAPREAEEGPPVERASERPVILFLGTSLSAGSGVEPAEAFPAIIQRRLDSAGLDYQVVNGGESGATSAGGVRRIEWFVRLPLAAVVLELGANDGLRGQDIPAMRENLQTIIDRARAAHPNVKIIIAGMEAPPNLGREYTTAFRRVFRDLQRENDGALIPFLLEGVGGHPDLNQPDGIHPTARGHEVIADNVWPVLAGQLED